MKQGIPFEKEFVYGESTLAWDHGNRTKLVKTVAEPAEITGVVTPVTEAAQEIATGNVTPTSQGMVPSASAKRAEPVKMYGAARTNERYNPDFGDNTYARREDLSSAKGVVVPTSPEQSGLESDWYYEETPQASDQFEPYFGDNTYARREQLAKTPLKTAYENSFGASP
jgi:hypothetical protein